MTAVEPGHATPGSSKPEASVEDRVLTALCPYLAASDGTWRSAGFAREHRCGAVSPPAILAAEKQRRLCLTEAHWTCSTYEAARAARPILPDRPQTLPRPIARTTPVILDHGRIAITVPSFRAERPTGQAILVVLLGLAFVLIVLARLSAGGTPVGALGPGASTSPRASASVPATSTPTADVTSPPAASPSVDPAASVAPSTPVATPVPPVAGAKTYTVKRGDTLSTIATRFKTTSKILQQLNGIADPSKINIGQVLKLP
jgi:LysM repeat protein